MKSRVLVRFFSAVLLPFATAITILTVFRLAQYGASFPSLAAVAFITLAPVSVAFFFSGHPEKETGGEAKSPGCLFMFFIGMDGVLTLVILLLLVMNIRLLIPYLRAVL